MSLWKIAQNVTQPIFWWKLINNFHGGKSWTKIWTTSVHNFQKPPKLNNLAPMGENSPNLVTLLVGPRHRFPMPLNKRWVKVSKSLEHPTKSKFRRADSMPRCSPLVTLTELVTFTEVVTFTERAHCQNGGSWVDESKVQSVKVFSSGNYKFLRCL
jgi:hypothetical protein